MACPVAVDVRPTMTQLRGSRHNVMGSPQSLWSVVRYCEDGARQTNLSYYFLVFSTEENADQSQKLPDQDCTGATAWDG